MESSGKALKRIRIALRFFVFPVLALNSILIGPLLERQATADESVVFEQTLPQALRDAREKSSNLKAFSSSAQAAQHQADSAGAALYPNLSVQGSYFYQTEVPSLTLGPVGPVSFGTNSNYSVGPVLSYTLFDGGKIRDNAKSHDLLAKARETNTATQEKQMELSVRQAYFRVQYALKQLVLTSDLLKLSSAQSRDIDLRFHAGSSSKLDQIQARRGRNDEPLAFSGSSECTGLGISRSSGSDGRAQNDGYVSSCAG